MIELLAIRNWAPAMRALVIKAMIAALALALPLMFHATAAKAAAPVEDFVQQSVDRAFEILNNKKLSDADRRDQFRGFLQTLLDIDRVALFTLGRARASASQADIDSFTDAFRKFAIANYETRLSGYSGQTLKVTGSSERAKGDYVVTTALIDPTDPSSASQPLEVDLRVLEGGGKFSVVDASVAGVWLGIAQRDDVAGFLSQHHGSIPDLVAHYKTMTDALYKQAASPPPQ